MKKRKINNVGFNNISLSLTESLARIVNYIRECFETLALTVWLPYSTLIMSLWNKTTDQLTPSKSAQDQVNSTCSFVDSSAERFSKLFAFCFTLLGSLFGNILIIIIVNKNRDLRKTINYFIVNMALSDLVLTLIVLPVEISRLVTDSLHWHLSGILGLICCKLFYFASSVSLVVSAESLVWIAIDRFVAVVFPMKLGLISGRTRSIAIVSTWMCAGFFSCPLLIISKLVASGSDIVCGETNIESYLLNKDSAIEAYVWFQFVLLIIAPLVVTTVLYTAIAITLILQKRALASTPPNAQRNAMKKRTKAIKMAVAIMALFNLCVIPHTLLYFIPHWRPSCVIQRVVYFVTSFSFYFSTSVNPIICLSFVESYRRGLRNILCPCVRQRNNMMVKREQVSLKKMKSLLDE